MKHRNFVVASTVVLFLVAGLVAGLALYSTVVVKASIPGLPEAVAYLPSDAQAVFGMNVQKFVESPIYARFEQRHGEQIGKDLSEFVASTGVDPRRDIHYIVAAGKHGDQNDHSGVIIAEGNFNTTAITTFLSTKAAPIKLDYEGATVLMVPERNGSKIEKGIAFLSEKEIALGELGALKTVLDIRRGKGDKAGVLDNPTLGPLIKNLNSDEMFWFAGDAANMLSKAPANTPLGANINAITHVFGTLNLTDAVDGTIMVTAKDEVSAGKLADVAKGLVALGQLASDQNAEIADLMKGITVQQIKDQIQLKVNFPIELLEKLDHARPAAAKKVV
jgi:hypothetical protein